MAIGGAAAADAIDELAAANDPDATGAVVDAAMGDDAALGATARFCTRSSKLRRAETFRS